MCSANFTVHPSWQDHSPPSGTSPAIVMNTMRPIHTILTTCALLMCLLATLTSEARAQESRWPTDGVTTRIGTTVGYSDVANSRWSTIGGHVAVGYRIGKVALEGEYQRSKLLQYNGLTNRNIGDHKRFGANLRLYFANLRAGASKRTRMLLFGEGSLGWQRGQLSNVDFSRKDYGLGFGWLLNHRVKNSNQGLDSIGWHVGWRLTNSTRANDAMARVVCGKRCPMEQPVPDTIDLGLTMSSSISLRWH